MFSENLCDILSVFCNILYNFNWIFVIVNLMSYLQLFFPFSHFSGICSPPDRRTIASLWTTRSTPPLEARVLVEHQLQLPHLPKGTPKHPPWLQWPGEVKASQRMIFKLQPCQTRIMMSEQLLHQSAMRVTRDAGMGPIQLLWIWFTNCFISEFISCFII